MISRLTPQEFAEDVKRAKKVIEDIAGTRVIGYRAPTFSVTRQTLWSLDVLMEAGFRYDSSIFPIVHDRYGIPDAPRFAHRIRIVGNGCAMAELPLSTLSVFGQRLPVAGGGYFRLLPYWHTRLAIRHPQGRAPAVVYLHPWEPDRTSLGCRSGADRLRHSINIDDRDAGGPPTSVFAPAQGPAETGVP
jgi:polysaccharide deacetylase family protein (PEP-CTERM system associated)